MVIYVLKFRQVSYQNKCSPGVIFVLVVSIADSDQNVYNNDDKNVVLHLCWCFDKK